MLKPGFLKRDENVRVIRRGIREKPYPFVAVHKKEGGRKENGDGRSGDLVNSRGWNPLQRYWEYELMRA